ncbi:AMP-binding protein [Rhodococcus hoagii]|nr:AMP-binding protein [Prescottella equi]
MGVLLAVAGGCTSGGCVADGHRDPAYLVRVMAECGVTVAHFVPSMLSVFVAEPAAKNVTTLRNVFASGEALPASTAARLRDVVPVRRCTICMARPRLRWM